MQTILKSVLALATLCLFYNAQCQNVPQLQKLKDYVLQTAPPGYDSSGKNIYLYHGKNINYFYPLYQLFRNAQKFKTIFKGSRYYDELSSYISFTGDYQSALQYMINGYDTVSTADLKQINKAVDALKGIEHADAARTIFFAATNRRVVMINEAPNKPVHRAFVISLLGGLYRRGFRYLALEMLNNSNKINATEGINALTGHYTAEPVAA